jgi:hypothetical protein
VLVESSVKAGSVRRLMQGGARVETGGQFVNIKRAGRTDLDGSVLVEQEDHEVAGMDVEAVANIGSFAGTEKRQVLEGEAVVDVFGGGDGDNNGVANRQLKAVALDELELALEVWAVDVWCEDHENAGVSLKLGKRMYVLGGAGSNQNEQKERQLQHETTPWQNGPADRGQQKLPLIGSVLAEATMHGAIFRLLFRGGYWSLW